MSFFDGKNDENVAFLRYAGQIDKYVKLGVMYVIFIERRKISNKNYRFWIFDLKEFKFNFQSLARRKSLKIFLNFWDFFSRICEILRDFTP